MTFTITLSGVLQTIGVLTLLYLAIKGIRIFLFLRAWHRQ